MSKKNRNKKTHIWGYTWWKKPQMSHKELMQQVNPLLGQIRQVDEVVAKIARGDGRIADLVSLGNILSEPLPLKSFNRSSVKLAQPEEVRSALNSLSQQLHLEVGLED